MGITGSRARWQDDSTFGERVTLHLPEGVVEDEQQSKAGRGKQRGFQRLNHVRLKLRMFKGQNQPIY
jgi:hypothetical protein